MYGLAVIDHEKAPVTYLIHPLQRETAQLAIYYRCKSTRERRGYPTAIGFLKPLGARRRNMNLFPESLHCPR
jgi:hypothetical protein